MCVYNAVKEKTVWHGQSETRAGDNEPSQESAAADATAKAVSAVRRSRNVIHGTQYGVCHRPRLFLFQTSELRPIHVVKSCCNF